MGGLPAVPIFALIVFIFWSFGSRLLSWAKLDLEEPGKLALGVAASYGAVTLFVFTLAVFRGVTVISCLLLLTAMAAVSFPQLRSNGIILTRTVRGLDWRSILVPRGSWESWAAWIAVVILLLGFVQAMAPATGIDTGRIHFTAVKMMIREHGLSPGPELWFHRTGGFHLVYLFGMTLQGEALAKLLAFGVSPTVLLLAAAASTRLKPGSGRIAAFIVAVSPLFTSFTGYEFLELPVLMYLLAAFLSLQGYQAAGGAGWAASAGAFVGLALSVKVSAFPVVLLLPPMLLAAVRRDRGRSYVPLMAGALAICVTGGFWPLWNRLTTGSYLYSGYLESVPQDVSGSTPTVAQGILAALRSVLLTSEYWSDSAGPLVIVAVAGVVVLGGPPASRLPAFLFLVSVPFYLVVIAFRARYYFQTDSHARYLGPFLLAFGALSAGPLLVWGQTGPRYLRTVLIWAALIPALPLLILKAGKTAVAAPAAIGLESRSHYLSKKIETFQACEILNALPDLSVKVLFLAQRPYYLDRPMAPEVFWQGVRNRDDLLRRIQETRVTHVLYEPETSRISWLQDPDAVFGGPPFREMKRWPWKRKGFVRLYAVERP